MSIIPSSNHYPVKSTPLRRTSSAVSTRELRKRGEFWVNPPLNRQERRFAAEQAYLQSMLARRHIVPSSSIRSRSPVNGDGPCGYGLSLPQSNCFTLTHGTVKHVEANSKGSEAVRSLSHGSLPTTSKEPRSLAEMLCDTQTKLSNLLEQSVDVILTFPDLERKYRTLKKFGERCLEHKELDSSQRTALKIFDAFSEDIKKCYEICALDEFDLQKLAENNFRAIRFLVTLTNDWVELTSNYSTWGALDIIEKMSTALVDCEDYIYHTNLIKNRLKEIADIYEKINRPQEALDMVNLAFEFSNAIQFLNAVPKPNRETSSNFFPMQDLFL